MLCPGRVWPMRLWALRLAARWAGAGARPYILICMRQGRPEGDGDMRGQA